MLREFYKDIKFDPMKELREIYKVTQGDTKSRGLIVTLILGDIVTPAGLHTMKFFAVKPDKTAVLANATIDGDKFIVDFTNQVLAVPGVVVCSLVLYGTDGEKIADKKFKLIVESSLEDGAVISVNERGILDRAFELAEDIVPRLELLDLSEALRVTAELSREEAEALREESHEAFLNLSDRVDTIITTPVEGVSAQEIIDARGGEVTLGARVNGVVSQLAEKTQQLDTVKQLDYVNYLSKSASIKSKMSLQILVGNLKQFFVNVGISDTQGIQYGFRKDGNDDYITFMDGALGTIVPIYAITANKNYEAKTGTFWEANAPNYYTTTIGDSFTATFMGAKIAFNSYCNNQGGLWRFTLDEGTGGSQTKDVSCFSTAPIVVKSTTLFEGLDNKKHTIKAVFIGQDPANPLASPRGWYYFGGTRTQDTYRTFDIYSDTFTVTQTTSALYHYANKDFALSCRPFESTGAYNFIPEHNLTGTAFNLVDTQLLVDGKPVIWNTGNYYTDIEAIQLIQKVKGVHPSDAVNPICEVTTIHTIKNGVVTISGKVKFLRKTSIDVGYTMMLPYFCAFAKKIKTSAGNVYPVIANNPMYKEYFPQNDIKSVCIVNDIDNDEKADIAIAMTIDNFDTTNRKGKTDIGAPFGWIEHRSDLMGKVYFQQFKNAVMEVGEQYRFDGRFLVCKIPKVNNYVL